TLISHANASGDYLEYTDALKKNVNIGAQPAILKDTALAILARSAPMGAYPPKVELVILPVMERVLAATGAPVDTAPASTAPVSTAPVTRKPAPSAAETIDVPAGSVDADDTVRRVREYRLVYEIRTGEGAEGHYRSTLYRIDANTGDVL